MDTDNFSMVTGGDFDDDLSSEDLSDQPMVWKVGTITHGKVTGKPPQGSHQRENAP